MYNSQRRAPLGSSHDLSPGLPKHLHPSQVSFGVATVKSRRHCQSTYVWSGGGQIYQSIRGVGEMVDRDYDWSVPSTYTAGSMVKNSNVQINQN